MMIIFKIVKPWHLPSRLFNKRKTKFNSYHFRESKNKDRLLVKRRQLHSKKIQGDNKKRVWIMKNQRF